MFTSFKNALGPVLTNMATGATFAAGAVIGIGAMKAISNLVSKGADTLNAKLEERKRRVVVEERNTSSASA